MCKLSKDDFLDRTPGCVGDILFEHLQLLQQDSESRSPPPPMTMTTTSAIQHIIPAHSNQLQQQQHHHHHHLQQQQHQHQRDEIFYEDLHLMQPQMSVKALVVPKTEVEFSQRYGDDARINCSPPMPTYDHPYGNASAIYAAMAAFRPSYHAPVPSQPFSMYPGEPYQFPHHSAAYNPHFSHGQVSHNKFNAISVTSKKSHMSIKVSQKGFC